MTQWEYRILVPPTQADEATIALNLAGEDSWELVAVTLGGAYVLKRPTEDGDDQNAIVVNVTGETIDPQKIADVVERKLKEIAQANEPPKTTRRK